MNIKRNRHQAIHPSFLVSSQPDNRNAGQLAWRLAGELSPILAEADKTSVYVELGAGEIWSVIHRMLAIAVRERLSLPADLIDELTAWLDTYDGSIEEPVVRDLLTQVQGFGGAV